MATTSRGRPPVPAARRDTSTLEFVRLASCARCGSRRRALVDAARGVRARCLNCGADLEGPFDIEALELLTVVGRSNAEPVRPLT